MTKSMADRIAEERSRAAAALQVKEVFKPVPAEPRRRSSSGPRQFGPPRATEQARAGASLGARAESAAKQEESLALRVAIRCGREAFGARRFWVVQHKSSTEANPRLRSVDSLDDAPSTSWVVVREVPHA